MRLSRGVGVVAVSIALAGLTTPPPAHAVLTCSGPGVYFVDDEADLRALASTTACWAPGLEFIVTQDIELIIPWTPIGDETTKFRGIFDGNGKSIDGLAITFPSSPPSPDYQGLFGYTENATIKNVILTDVSITNSERTVHGPQFVGGLIGRASNTDVLNSTVSGSIDATNYVGGVVGYAEAGTVIEDCSSSGSVGSDASISSIGGIVGYARSTELTDVTSSASVAVTRSLAGGGSGVGGIVGDSYAVNITRASASGTITAFQRSGGIAGSFNVDVHDDTGIFTVSQSHATGDVIGEPSASDSTNVGGLIGEVDGDIEDTDISSLRILDSFATGDVSAGWFVGGLLGVVRLNNDPGAHIDLLVEDSYATASVTGNSYVGGLIGVISTDSGEPVDQATIRGTRASGDVIGNGSVGGLVGQLEGGALIESYATGRVEGATTGDRSRSGAGGLVGLVLNSGTIARSYATGSVSGLYRVGGLVGELDGASSGPSVSVSDSYATGSVFASGISLEAYVGGITGMNRDSVTIENSYYTGGVSTNAGSTFVGGVTGMDFSAMDAESIYWNTETTGIGFAAGNSDNSGEAISGASGLTTRQMRYSSNFSGWDFLNIWGFQCSTSTSPQLRDINSSATATSCPEPPPDSGGESSNGGSSIGGSSTTRPTPTPPVSLQPLLVEQRPGTSSMTINGKSVPVTTTPGRGGAGVSLSAGPVNFALRGVTAAGQRVPLEGGETLVLPRTGQVPTTARGLEPGSQVTQALYSSPVVLGTSTVNAQGTLTTSAVIPSSTPAGPHTLQLTGRTETGEAFTLNIGVLVMSPAAALGADPQLSLSRPRVREGDEVIVTATGVQARCRVTLRAGPVRAQGRASAKGRVTTVMRVTVPKRGPWTVTARVSGPGCNPIRASAVARVDHLNG